MNVPDKQCIQVRLAFRLLSSLITGSDAITLMLPMPHIWRSSMTLSRKIQLTGVFLLGSMVVVVAIIRLTLTVSNLLRSSTCTLVFLTELLLS